MSSTPVNPTFICMGYLDTATENRHHRLTPTSPQDNSTTAVQAITAARFPVKLRSNAPLRLRLTLPRKVRRALAKQHAIYGIQRVSDGKMYVGKSCNVVKRFAGWAYAANHPERDIGRHVLARAIRQAPADFSLRILSLCSAGDVNRCEKACLAWAKQQPGGVFNQRQAGGGGAATPSYNCPSSALKLTSTFDTPLKSYALTSTLRVDLTPGVREKHRVIYQFQKCGTEERYVGATENFPQRMATHSSNFRHADSDAGQRSLPQAIRAAPNQWQVTVLSEVPADQSVKEWEKAAIACKQNAGRVLKNKDKGGGGPSADGPST